VTLKELPQYSARRPTDDWLLTATKVLVHGDDAEFRALMDLDWSEAQQRRFEWLLSALRLADRVIPHRAWISIYRLYLWDMRFRARRGWRIV